MSRRSCFPLNDTRSANDGQDGSVGLVMQNSLHACSALIADRAGQHAIGEAQGAALELDVPREGRWRPVAQVGDVDAQLPALLRGLRRPSGPGEATAEILLTWAADERKNRAAIVGTSGAIRLDGNLLEITAIGSGKPIVREFPESLSEEYAAWGRVARSPSSEASVTRSGKPTNRACRGRRSGCIRSCAQSTTRPAR